MTDNQYKFLILTGKYYPDEDIQFDGYYYYFEKRNEQMMMIHYEDSTGYLYLSPTES